MENCEGIVAVGADARSVRVEQVLLERFKTQFDAHDDAASIQRSSPFSRRFALKRFRSPVNSPVSQTLAFLEQGNEDLARLEKGTMRRRPVELIDANAEIGKRV